MKKIGLVIGMLLVVFACKKGEKVMYKTFGETMEASNFISKEEMKEKFETMKAGDTLDVRFASNINSVCKAKGCWMKLDLGEEKESMVKFKDYGFFVPLNSDNTCSSLKDHFLISVQDFPVLCMSMYGFVL